MSWTDRACGIGDEAAPGLTEQLAIHRELGLGAIELRTVDGRGLHELTADALAEVAERVRAAGLVVPVVDTPIGNWSTTVATGLDAELSVLAGSAAAAHALGSRWLRVMSYPNDGRPEAEWAAESLRRMAVLTREAERLDVRLLHENCQGWAGRGPDETLRLLDHVASPALRLVFDIGNGLAYGYEATEFLGKVLPWVDHVHIKDGHRTPDGAVFTLPGRGEVEVADCVRQLEQAGYRGRYSLEPHVAHIPHLAATAGAAELAAGYRACALAFREIWETIPHD
ncbi:sugar phosphate isomerase/epimerase [Streptomyces sp. NBC_00083]|uniref:sugar phosphate isomerase/epimerase family protein n=1 Tax=Streptomyces sp. NBC_00083 TaxID=2975647 RepID=UPI002255CFF0|nr:TIM barrel protein [Streptomyces sp. NBC_00083]MCX5382366.1 sugar phosphate isomerase/epimerase [Streptomyces sp. NBC_00083]